MPIAIGVMSAVGLISALLGDGLWDTLSWIALAIPVAVVCRMASGRIVKANLRGLSIDSSRDNHRHSFDRNGYVKRVNSGQCGLIKVHVLIHRTSVTISSSTECPAPSARRRAALGSRVVCPRSAPYASRSMWSLDPTVSGWQR